MTTLFHARARRGALVRAEGVAFHPQAAGNTWRRATPGTATRFFAFRTRSSTHAGEKISTFFGGATRLVRSVSTSALLMALIFWPLCIASFISVGQGDWQENGALSQATLRLQHFHMKNATGSLGASPSLFKTTVDFLDVVFVWYFFFLPRRALFLWFLRQPQVW